MICESEWDCHNIHIIVFVVVISESSSGFFNLKAYVCVHMILHKMQNGYLKIESHRYLCLMPLRSLKAPF